jgi:vacuole morphology and inheritance protein 14
LFTTLYRCWSHNPVSVFSLCLLAQAYEHASNLLYILYVRVLPWMLILAYRLVTSADLEITVPLLVQIDKLVQLIESPVFTCKLHRQAQLCRSNEIYQTFDCSY